MALLSLITIPPLRRISPIDLEKLAGVISPRKHQHLSMADVDDRFSYLILGWISTA
jgi:hypothetical protein